jgi:hypothetical protein
MGGGWRFRSWRGFRVIGCAELAKRIVRGIRGGNSRPMRFLSSAHPMRAARSLGPCTCRGGGWRFRSWRGFRVIGCAELAKRIVRGIRGGNSRPMRFLSSAHPMRAGTYGTGSSPRRNPYESGSVIGRMLAPHSCDYASLIGPWKGFRSGSAVKGACYTPDTPSQPISPCPSIPTD